MKYVSVWDNDNNSNNNDIIKHINEWTSLIDKENNSIIIGKNKDDYRGVRGIIGGNNNNLLFITYYPKNIEIFDLDKLQFIKKDILPIVSGDWIRYHCFILIKDNTNNNNKMLLFCKNIGLSIDYNEGNNTFQFNDVWICSTIRLFNEYAYVYVDDFILFFDGHTGPFIDTSKAIYKYSISKNKWIEFEYNLTISLKGCTGTLSEDRNYIYFFGGNYQNNKSSTNFKTKVKEWMREEETEKERQWIIEEREKMNIDRIKKQLKNITGDFDIEEWKKKRLNEIETIIEYWLRSLSIKIGWINDFTIITLKYILRKYFKPSKVFQLKSGSVGRVKFSPDSTKITVSLGNTIQIWDIKLEKETHVLSGHSSTIFNLQFSPDSNLIASSSYDETIRLWDVKSSVEVLRLEGYANIVKSIHFSPDGKNILFALLDDTIRIWSIQFGQEMKSIKGKFGSFLDVKYFPNGEQLISFSNNTIIQILDLKSGDIISTLKGHKNQILAAQFSRSGLFIVSSSSDETIRLWDVTSGMQLKQFYLHCRGINNIQFLDEQTIVCHFSKVIRLWDLKAGMEIQQLQGHSDDTAGVDVSPDEAIFVRLMKLLKFSNLKKLSQETSCSIKQKIKFYKSNFKLKLLSYSKGIV
ncbi:G-protein beta WD-40 repeats containing protein [Reticulomyxa filosa]|uniref:G-protein beta WD-40 repeats containing protein n=1 Tax=Reticulomyxa filosa TaxID=46433 RepID=X6MDR2_RETFI|nr:G-protein beta WD-40 repeats containing protein [Reticulomyxa filosa]|eukprot:ETO11796.1 G-protein beta WD-40 repeats containing protein [Reticulomyxa filosa]